MYIGAKAQDTDIQKLSMRRRAINMKLVDAEPVAYKKLSISFGFQLQQIYVISKILKDFHRMVDFLFNPNFKISETNWLIG